MAALDSLLETLRQADDSEALQIAAGALVAAHGSREALRRAELLSACYAKHGNPGTAEAWQQVAKAIRRTDSQADNPEPATKH